MISSLRNYVFAFFAFSLVLASCSKENIDEMGSTEPNFPEVTELTQNPLLNRSLGDSDEGLDFDCFIILYPFSLLDIEGVEYAVTEVGDLLVLEDKEIVDFVYPLTIKIDEEIESADSADDLMVYFAECLPEGGWYEGDFPAYLINYETSCYQFVYPISLENLDGEVVVANTEEDFNTALATAPHNFVFPFDLIKEDGETVTATDIDGLFEALFACNEFEIDSTVIEWETGFEYLGCYMLVFPFEIELSDGTIVTVNNHEEFCEYMFTGDLVDFVYPLTLIDENGEACVADTAEDLEEKLEDCWSFEVEGEWAWLLAYGALEGLEDEDSGQCYDIVYPISGEDLFTGELITINDDEEYLEALLGVSIFNVYFPVTITLLSDSSEVVITEVFELVEVINNCQ